MAPDSNTFQDDYEVTREPQHVHAANKLQTRKLDANHKAADLKEIIKCISSIDDIEKNNLSGLLRKYEHLKLLQCQKFITTL
jgi:CBS-domain-containing membrane protein